MNARTWTVSWIGHLRDACCHTRFGRNSGRTAECNILDDDDDDNLDEDEDDGDQSNNKGDDENEDEAVVQKNTIGDGGSTAL